MKLSIGFDFDDVVVDTIAYKKAYLERFGTEVLKSNIYNDLEASLELLKFKPGAIEGITKLQSYGFGLQIITARGTAESRIVNAFLERSNLILPIHAVGYGNSKLSYTSKCDIFIDDDPKNLIPAIGTKTKLFLMTTEENTEFENENITRVGNWEEFMSLICKEG